MKALAKAQTLSFEINMPFRPVSAVKSTILKLAFRHTKKEHKYKKKCINIMPINYKYINNKKWQHKKITNKKKNLKAVATLKKKKPKYFYMYYTKLAFRLASRFFWLVTYIFKKKTCL